MADTKISALTSATTPLTGAELVPIVQSGSTVKTTVANILTGASPGSFTNVTVTSATIPLNGIYLPSANTLGFATNSTQRALIGSAGNVTIAAPTSGTAFTVTAVAGSPAISAVGVITHSGTYGGIYLYDGVTAQSIATGSTPTLLTCWNTAAGGNDTSNDMTPVKASNKITVTRAGKYLLSWDIAFTSGTSNVNWEFYAFVGGVQQNQSGSKTITTNTTGNFNCGSSAIITCTASQDVDLRGYHDNGGSVNITATHATMALMFVGS